MHNGKTDDLEAAGWERLIRFEPSKGDAADLWRNSNQDCILAFRGTDEATEKDIILADFEPYCDGIGKVVDFLPLVMMILGTFGGMPGILVASLATSQASDYFGAADIVVNTCKKILHGGIPGAISWAHILGALMCMMNDEKCILDDWYHDFMDGALTWRGLPRMHQGFLLEAEPILKLTDEYDFAGNCTGSFIVSGHSLGGGLANLFTASTNVPILTCDTLTPERTCNRAAPHCFWNSGACREADRAEVGDMVSTGSCSIPSFQWKMYVRTFPSDSKEECLQKIIEDPACLKEGFRWAESKCQCFKNGDFNECQFKKDAILYNMGTPFQNYKIQVKPEPKTRDMKHLKHVDMKRVKHVDYLFTFGSVKPSWISPLTNGKSRDGSFAGARYVTGVQLADGSIQTDAAEANPTFALVSRNILPTCLVFLMQPRVLRVLRFDRYPDVHFLLAGLETSEDQVYL